MEELSKTALVDRELEEAQDDLRQTLEQVNHKVEEVEARLRPQAILRRNPLALPLLAGVAGLLAGSERQAQPMRWLVIGALLGAALAAAHQGDDKHNGTSESNRRQ